MWTITTRRCTLQLFVWFPTQPVVCCSILCFCCYHILLFFASFFLLLLLFSNNNNRSKVDAYSSGDNGEVEPLYSELVILSTWRRHLFASPLISLFLLALSTPAHLQGDKLYTSSSIFAQKQLFLLSSSNANFSDSFALSSLPSFSKVLFKLSKSSAAFEMCRRRRQVVPLNLHCSLSAFGIFRRFLFFQLAQD